MPGVSKLVVLTSASSAAGSGAGARYSGKSTPNSLQFWLIFMYFSLLLIELKQHNHQKELLLLMALICSSFNVFFFSLLTLK